MPGDLTSVLAALICAAFVTAAEPVLIPLLRRAAVDVPNERSSHSVPTPRGGGAPIAAGLVLAALLLMHGTVAMTFAAIGFADDDLAAAGLLTAYLRSPVLLGRARVLVEA